ncbi:hypothetical protein [Mycobacterium botniense]|uniref:Transmembrane protein n=1 Tax=Mycobacterium botniense TaxID=84962 RepID=A0A7I9XV57_9MYCO|nr:hypothetical protein [Mycobacterium botniense]GFG73386.1 hypothetical protein MBOT_07510 [Mycobacterium botniense]
MTGPDSDTQTSTTRPISVAELLARNGTIGAPPVTGRRRRRRGNSDAVTVAELTGEIPVVGREDHHDETTRPGPAAHSHRANGAPRLAEPVPDERPEPVPDPDHSESGGWPESQSRWTESTPAGADSGLLRSRYLRSLPLGAEPDDDRDDEPPSGAERMSPDPLENYADIPVDVMDTDVREAEPATEDSAYVRSYLRAPVGRLLGGIGGTGRIRLGAADKLADTEELAADADVDHGDSGGDVEGVYEWPSRTETLLRGGLIVLQSILAVAFGAGLFIAFDQLWRWNNIVALVLSVLVILGLVVGVRIVRRTEDIASTLIAVAVGALVTLGPLALLQSG